jgi:hypothetical protein
LPTFGRLNPFVATTNHDQIDRIWSRRPYNIAIATGPSGLLVVDLDQPKTATDQPTPPWNLKGIRNGRNVLDALARRAGQTLPATYTVTTPSGGTHLYFTQPRGHQLRNTAGRLGWKIDTRGHGGYVVAAGSIVDTAPYLTTCCAPPAPLPNWIATALTQTPEPEPESRSTGHDLHDKTAYALAALRGELARVLAAAQGTRNHTLNTAAFALGQLVGGDQLDHTTVETALASAAARIGLGPVEAARTIDSGLTAGTRRPRTIPA